MPEKSQFRTKEPSAVVSVFIDSPSVEFFSSKLRLVSFESLIKYSSNPTRKSAVILLRFCCLLLKEGFSTPDSFHPTLINAKMLPSVAVQLQTVHFLKIFQVCLYNLFEHVFNWHLSQKVHLNVDKMLYSHLTWNICLLTANCCNVKSHVVCGPFSNDQNVEATSNRLK